MNEELLARVKNSLEKDWNEIKIDLSNEGLIDEDIIALVQFLQKSEKKIKFLNLYRNNIGNKGAEALATLTNVYEIDLSCNRVKDEGLKALITNPKIKQLNLSDNTSISDKCAAFVIENVQQTYLCLEKTKIHRDNLSQIEETVNRNNQTYAKRSKLLDAKKLSRIAFFEEAGTTGAQQRKSASRCTPKSADEFAKIFLEKHPEVAPQLKGMFSAFLLDVLEQAPHASLGELVSQRKSPLESTDATAEKFGKTFSPQQTTK